jgi:hypothetical protein
LRLSGPAERYPGFDDFVRIDGFVAASARWYLGSNRRVDYPGWTVLIRIHRPLSRISTLSASLVLSRKSLIQRRVDKSREAQKPGGSELSVLSSHQKEAMKT